MRITAVEPLVLGTSWRNLIFLKVSTDEGLVGLGECTIQNREEGVLGYLPGAVRRHVLGSDPFNLEDLWLRMYRNDFWRGGVIATTVMSGIEVACWDINEDLIKEHPFQEGFFNMFEADWHMRQSKNEPQGGDPS